MLYRLAPLDFSKSVLVVAHVPKTAGSSLCTALFAGLGRENCVVTAMEKIEKVYSGEAHRFAWGARELVRKTAMRARGRHPLLPRRYTPAELERVLLFEGHFALGGEPRTSRRPVYVTLLRDPVDRFLSLYYYSHDLRGRWPEGVRDRHPYWTYDLDRFVEYIYARRKWTVTNVHCRYIGGDETFETARQAVDGRVFLAAPTERLGDCLALLAPVLDLKAAETPRANVGVSRPGKAPPSSETLAKIRAMVAQDQLLFDYVSHAFDDLHREISAKLGGGRGIVGDLRPESSPR
jgi:hypothetical protein